MNHAANCWRVISNPGEVPSLRSIPLLVEMFEKRMQIVQRDTPVEWGSYGELQLGQGAPNAGNCLRLDIYRTVKHITCAAYPRYNG